MDFQKAFDSVPHKRLMQKVKFYGITRNVLSWLENFLHKHQQKVIVNKAVSKEEETMSGVPQGSVLGQILFVLYINDLPEYITSDIRIFTDDTKIFRPISSKRDCDALRSHLTNLEILGL